MAKIPPGVGPRYPQVVILGVSLVECPRAVASRSSRTLRSVDRNETQRFEQALKTGFVLTEVDGPFELRRRDTGVNQIDCTGITD